MRYFTREWFRGDLDESEIELREISYKNYINNIYEKLPFVLKLIANRITLHDGKLMKLVFFKNERKLVLKGIFGDLQIGYYFLEIIYYGVADIALENVQPLFVNRELDILSDEIELGSKRPFLHRMLFSSMNEIEIQFENIQITVKNTTYNSYKKTYCHFEIL